jgi:hypothetical protein
VRHEERDIVGFQHDVRIQTEIETAVATLDERVVHGGEPAVDIEVEPFAGSGRVFQQSSRVVGRGVVGH